LPATLLRADWPRSRAHTLFTERHEQWASAARTYFDELESNYRLDTRAA